MKRVFWVSGSIWIIVYIVCRSRSTRIVVRKDIRAMHSRIPCEGGGLTGNDNCYERISETRSLPRTITQWARRGGYQPAIGRPILGLCTRSLRARSAPLDARPPREIMDCHDATDNRLEDVDISTNRILHCFSTSLFFFDVELG